MGARLSRFKCPACLQNSSTRKLLPCLHSICQNCVEKCLEHSKVSEEKCYQFQCPICVKIVTKPPQELLEKQWAWHFPVNAVLLSSLHDTKTKVVQTCDPCMYVGESNTATSYCATCKEILCPTCDGAHRKSRATRQHTFLRLDEIVEPAVAVTLAVSMTCTYHWNKDVEFYCVSHNSVCCSECLDCHRGCNEILKLKEHVDKLLKADELSKLTERMKALEDHLEKFTAANDETQRELETSTEEMTTEIDKLIAILNEAKSRMSKEREGLLEGESRTRRSENQQCESLKATFRDFYHMLGAVVKYGDKYQSLVILHKVKEILVYCEKTIQDNNLSVRQVEAKLQLNEHLISLRKLTGSQIAKIEVTENKLKLDPCVHQNCSIRSDTILTMTDEVLTSTTTTSKDLVPGKCRCTFPGSVYMEIVQGDITKETTDAIVNSVLSNLDLTQGQVSKAILTAGGNSIQQECLLKVGDFKTSGFAITKAGVLPCKGIIHMVAQDKRKDWEDMIKQVLCQADKLFYQSISFPALGTGFKGLSPEKIAQTMYSACAEFAKSQPNNLKQVRVVLFQDTMWTIFVQAIKVHSSGQSESKTLGRIPRTREKMSSLVLSITTDSKSNAQSAIGDIESFVKSEIMEKEINSPREIISKLLDRQIEKMELMGQGKAMVSVNQRKSIILVSGAPKEVLDTYDRVMKYLRNIEIDKMKETQEKLKKQQEMTDGRIPRTREKMSSLVLSITTDSKSNAQSAIGDIESLVKSEIMEKEINSPREIISKLLDRQITKIELMGQGKAMVSVNQRKSIILVSGAPKEVLDTYDRVMKYLRNIEIDKMKETQEKLKKQQEMSDLHLPRTWTPMANDENLKCVSLNPTDQEYIRVSQKFLASAGGAGQLAAMIKFAMIYGSTGLTVIRIERVQNKSLYQEYKAKKTQLEQQNNGRANEKELWHETADTNILNINHNGFNRSYSGSGSHGDGTYFAVNASYSVSGYCRVDASGHRHIYLAHVMTGDSIVLGSGTRVLPPKDPKNPHITYNSTTDNLANPQMFVIFDNTQAYPSYHITFR